MAAESAPEGAGGAGLAVTPPKTFLDSVIDSIITPGASSGLVATINGALLLLLATLAAWAVAYGADVHTAVLAFFSVGLLGSLNYYISAGRAAQRDGDGTVAAAATVEAEGGDGKPKAE
jgi:hypothetical protein